MSRITDRVWQQFLRLAVYVVFSVCAMPASGAVVEAPWAAISERVAPDYTPEARVAGLEGSVILYLEVSAVGELETVHVLEGLGMGLNEKAIEAVKRWRFAAATKDGVPVRIEQSVEVRLRLRPAASSWQIRRCFYQTGRGGFLRRSRFLIRC